MTKSVFTPEYERFRLELVTARKKARVTQVALAKRLHQPQSFVSKYERGERRLDVVEFFGVARALRIDPFKLLRRLWHDAPVDGSKRRTP
ncbi:MAG: helix-turn-helix transcriptional regulator [Planctomycetota bacterium]